MFGIDLRKWAEGGWHELTTGEDKKELIPPVVSALFNALAETYKQLPDDSGTAFVSFFADRNNDRLVREAQKLDI